MNQPDWPADRDDAVECCDSDERLDAGQHRVNYSVIYNLASDSAIQTETLMSISSSGTQSNAATWSRAVQIERLQ